MPSPAPLHQEIRQLRSEVGQLRRDIQQLQELMKAQSQSKSVDGEASANSALHRALDQQVSFHMNGVPMQTLLKALARTTNINIVLHENSLAEEGVSPDTHVQLEVREVQLRSALNLLLEPLNLACVIENEVLLIVSQRYAQGPLTTHNYPVADLLGHLAEVPNFLQGRFSQTQDGSVARTPVGQFQQLKAVIQNTVRPRDW